LYQFIVSDEETLKAIDNIKKLKEFGLDCETDGLDPHKNNLILLQIGDEDQQYIFDCRKINILLLKNILETSIPKVTTNGIFDYCFLKKKGIELENIFDISLNEKILLAGRIKMCAKGYFSLASLSKKYLNIILNKELQTSFSIEGDIDTNQLKYASLDIICPLKIIKKQIDLLKKEGLIQTAKLENNAIPVFGDIKYNGFYLDSTAWKKLIDKVNNRRNNIKNNLDNNFRNYVSSTLFGELLINYDSPEQLLFTLNKMGFKIKDTRNETLALLENKNLSKLLIEYRSLSKAINSFGENYLQYINPVTGRIHPEINQIGASSGRVTMSHPNLQQQIKKDMGEDILGKEYRECWKSQESNNWLIIADYTGQELHIMAELSGEESWIETLNKKENLHSMIGKEIFGFEVSKSKNKNLYACVKAIVFGSAYGMNKYRLQQLYQKANIEKSIEKCAKDLESYYNSYPKVKRMLDDASIQALEEGWVSSIGGRKRYFNPPPYKLIKSKYGRYIPIPLQYGNIEHKEKLSSIMREGGNHIIQSTGVDITKKALINLRKEIKKGIPLLLVNTIHDEIITECLNNSPKAIAEQVISPSLLDAESFYLKKVNSEIEYSIGKEWIK